MSETALAEEMVERAVRPGGGVALRLDVLVWLGLIAAGAALRLARMEALPLTFEESARAFDALRSRTGPPHSPRWVSRPPAPKV